MVEVPFQQLLKLFDFKSLSIKERFDEFLLLFTLASIHTIDTGQFEDALKFLNVRDGLHLSFTIDDGESTDFYSGNLVSEFLNDLNGKLTLVEDEVVNFTIRITKNAVGGVISVYSYEDIINYFQSLTVQAILNDFNKFLPKENYLVFEFQTNEPVSKTKSIWFVNKGFSGTPYQIDRQPVLSKAQTSCYFNYLPKLSLIPQDFEFLELPGEKLAEVFNKLTSILSVAFLFDITNLQNNHLEFRLNGYKSINGTSDLSAFKVDPENQYFKIYNWVYDSGNFVDKIGLARNIISLHFENEKLSELKGDPFTSIQSSYKVYEKQNIKQYIEIRNKISDQLLSFHDRANKIIETFASGFQKSAFALLTFYISAIILKVLGKDKLVQVFTIDAAILSTSFILCSIIYYFVLKWEVKVQKDRFENNYNDVKKRYTDLLDQQDISRILNNDHEFNSDLKFIQDKGKNYTIMWFSFLAIFFVSTWLLYFTYNPQFIFDLGHWFGQLCARKVPKP
jgi:hypothetical protein